MSSFDATPHASERTLLEPMHRFLDLGQGQGVLTAGEGASLEAAQTVGHDGEQDFLGESVDSDLVDRAVLE